MLNLHIISDLLYMFRQPLVSLKESVWRMKYSFPQQKVSWNHMMKAMHICFHPAASGYISQPLSKKAWDILLCEMAIPKPGTPSMRHSEVPIHASFILVSLDWLAKSMFHGFCKIRDAICQAWLLSAPTEQSRNGSGPTNHKWIAEVEAAEL